MGRLGRYVAVMLLLLAVVAVAMGAIFIYQAVEKESWMRGAMQAEQVTLGLSEEEIAEGQVVDSLEEAQIGGDTIRGHRRNIASTYEELLGGGRFDPNNAEHLTYAQAMNMENYLYLAVLSFGVTRVIIGTGAFMILTGVGLGGTGVVLLGLTRRLS